MSALGGLCKAASRESETRDHEDDAQNKKRPNM